MTDEQQAREVLRKHRGDGTGCYGLYSEDEAVAAMLAFRAAQPGEGGLRENLAKSLYEATFGGRLVAWDDPTRDYWLRRADAALAAPQEQERQA